MTQGVGHHFDPYFARTRWGDRNGFAHQGFLRGSSDHGTTGNGLIGSRGGGAGGAIHPRGTHRRAQIRHVESNMIGNKGRNEVVGMIEAHLTSDRQWLSDLHCGRFEIGKQ